MNGWIRSADESTRAGDPCALVTVVAYPLVWYLLHRFVLHGSFLYRSRWTAALWKRIHFDHHRDPARRLPAARRWCRRVAARAHRRRFARASRAGGDPFEW